MSHPNYADCEVLENCDYIRKRNIIIYGAGNFGKKAAEILNELGFDKYEFCDRDNSKQGTIYCGKMVRSVCEIEALESLLIIIAIGDKALRKEAEKSLTYIHGAKLLSFFALNKVYRFNKLKNESIATEMEMLLTWYNVMEYRVRDIKEACESPVWVYQNGKVGSTSISYGLKIIGIKNAHIHRFFLTNDSLCNLIFVNRRKEFIEKNIFQNMVYKERIKKESRNKKIITVVRDPIAVDFSTVMFWLGNGYADYYFTQMFRTGKRFMQIIVDLMVEMKNRLFEWFDEELKELFDIDVFLYPFDKSKGYSIIKNEYVEILVIKTEKLPESNEIIGKFVENNDFKIQFEKIGINSEYANLYKAVKERLVLPQEYIDFYYKGNQKVSHFYSEEEINQARRKWGITTTLKQWSSPSSSI